jgi:NodT family efflux transporter outer membrane factor (OMF) lipoprotein
MSMMFRIVMVVAVSAGLGACAVGPDYRRPDVAAPVAFKELPPPAAGWKYAQPRADAERTDWWKLFADAELDALMTQLDAANPDIRIAEARYRQARALAQSARAGFWPTLGASVTVTRGSGGFSSSTIAGGGSSIGTERNAALDASWEADVWGRVRRDVESGEAGAAASAADLASARLSAQAELAMSHFQLRVLDARQQLFDRTVAAYVRSLQMVRNRYAVGIVSRADIVQAETQLRSAQTQALDNRLQRAQLEHAMATLLGKAPAELTLAPMPLVDDVVQQAALSLPSIPLLLPSELLERRPDIAAAEQLVIAANAQIGIAQAAYFPVLSLAAGGGYRSASASDWLTAPNRYWSLGPALVGTLFDGGRRSAEKARAVAAYDETVANYRASVLSAFQEVEDNLSALQLLEQQAQTQHAAVEAARISVVILENQYKAGKAAYLDVISVRAIALVNERAALQILGQRYTACVQLIRALGGVW